MYINDLTNVVENCGIHIYADDVQVYLHCSPHCISEGVRLLNVDLNNIQKWADKNRLILNPSKTKCMTISPQSFDQNSIPDILINNCKIELVENAKNLGMVVDKTLSWNVHINRAIGKVYGMLRILWPLQSFIPFNIRLLLCKAYLIPALTYGCELFSNCDSIHNRKLNVIFNNIARFVFGKGRRDHISAFSI